MTAEFLRSIPHMRMRTVLQSNILRTRSQLIRAVHDYFEGVSEVAAFHVHPPLITSSDCEGAGEVFTVAPQKNIPSNPSAGENSGSEHFFSEPKYLTVSSQLHLEAFSAELGNVWALSPTFRAEQSDTTRHLAEFYMLEAEFRGVSQLESVIAEAENLIRYLAFYLSESSTGTQMLKQQSSTKYMVREKTNPPELQESQPLRERWKKLLTLSWPRITYGDAVESLEKAQAEGHTFTQAPSWEGGLSLEHERFLVSHVFGNKQPVVVTYYPAAQKPFYMLATDSPSSEASDGARETVECFDILLPDGYAEVCGGSLREHRLDKLIQRMRAAGMLKPDATTTAVSDLITPSASEAGGKKEALYPGLELGESLGAMKWYADLRRFGSSPHGGFGIGWDRLLAYLCGVSNVRDVVAFPRAWGRADC